MSDTVYKNLAAHLDNLPAGYPATDSGIEIKILKQLFTEKEAEVAANLTMMPEPVSAIAQRLNMDDEEASKFLYDMSKKGLIGRSSKTGENNYMAAQFVIGIWEYNLNNLSKELIDDVNEYLPHFAKEWEKRLSSWAKEIKVRSANSRKQILSDAYNILSE